MSIYVYSLPALVSLVAKTAILSYSLRSAPHNAQTRLFVGALLFSILLSVSELTVLQRISASIFQFAGIAYYATCVPMIALFVHLAISISIDEWRSSRMVVFYALFYGFVVTLCALIVYTPLVIVKIEDFGGYTGIGVQGPFYFLFELFIVPSFLAMLVLPMWGLKRSADPIRRNQCKLWLTVAAPLSLLIIFIMVLLHYEIHWFNATVTAPLLFAALMAAMGYSIHSRRPIEPDYFLPWSKTRRCKTELYDNLEALSAQIVKTRSIQFLVNRLADAFQCPAAVVTREALIASAGKSRALELFPKKLLRDIRESTLRREVSTAEHLGTYMDHHAVAAIVPFYPYNHAASTWILLGNPFGQKIYSRRDFRVIERLFDQIAILLLDRLFTSQHHIHRTRREMELLERRHAETKERLKKVLSDQPHEPAGLHKPLAKHLLELEAKIIEETLVVCNGNQAEAARLLGMKPNTLHYKLKQYRWSQNKENQSLKFQDET